ncbi:MAG TPA: IS1595 family transposase [Terriglobales bacterium]|jgi:transposase-like protein
MEAKTLQEAIKYFSDEQVCIDTVAKMRWPNGVECPACGAKEPYWIKTQKRWKCHDCRRQFSVKLGTIFEDSPIPLTKWLPAMWLLVNCKNGVSSYEIHRDLGVSQKAGWFMLHRLRLILQQPKPMTPDDQIGGTGAVEVDETFVGGRAKFMHKSKRLRLAQARSEIREAANHSGKTIVMGMLDRKLRQVRATVIPNTRRETLQNHILREVFPGSKVYTDEWLGYQGLAKKFAHEIVNHMETYVDGKVHTQGIENFWSLLKRGLKGTYVAVEPFHLFRYVDEQVFRFNNRKNEDGTKITDAERFTKALSLVAGKRLTFAEVTGKAGSEATF